MIARRALVVGRVQGVGFRWSTQEAARRLGLAGWVRNLPDGAVEVHWQGASDLVDALEEWLGHGPPSSHVATLTCSDTPVDDSIEEFTIRR